MSRWFRNDRWDFYAPVMPKSSHVWVLPPTQVGNDFPPVAGLVTSWKQTSDGSWLAQTVLVWDDQVTVQWLPADRLTPV